ncbi:DNA (cytosine-5-)-methyltransferase [Tenacibaculum sp. FZY0031]|uniref:DNA cytosine methyltransferase n=1 Tax=Tenacibaculum sp. FZY0031 TaxID=3116648 RepID=UPI002EB56B14|nr:DNA (cytosine-5-)-methyltransferase [Tenacibaculum sp. FZY0031]
MKFIDLFAGIGGFHIALEKLGHECVFASEKRINLAELYEKNFEIEVNRDITKIEVSDIPTFDILCAGFPCQPFSKAGKQDGLLDERNGSLFDKIVDILEFHKPKYFILENVRNLISHDNENTWFYIKEQLENKLGYKIDKKIYSPHNFGIPQHRERLFIIGSIDGLDHFEWLETTNKTTSIFEYLDKNPANARKLENEKIQVIDIWQEFISKIPKEHKLPSFPIWSMEFGATYPFEEKTPFASSTKALANKKGIFGVDLKGLSRQDKFAKLPSYARTEQAEFPSWKKNYIRQNRAFYEKYKDILEPIVKKIEKLKIASWQKLEWNVQGGERDLYKYIIQFRGSGVRIKKTDFFPSLVTVSTQIPIISWEKRYITPSEGARIQSLNGIELPENIGTCFSALGNAVNGTIVRLIAEKLIKKEPNTIKFNGNSKVMNGHKAKSNTPNELDYERIE